MNDLSNNELKLVEGGNVLESIMFALGYTFGKMAKGQANFTMDDYAMNFM